ncbi:MAG: RNA polymerase sigma factor [Gammaproteobacteria bacterium]|nr:RNA polymerase sigma factor [Gammaproteobacteria bacterium]
MFDKEILQQLYRYAYSLTCDEHDAYDLLQGAIEKFIKSNIEANQPTAYIKKIIYNRFIDDCRRQKIVQFENMEEAALPADFDVQTLEELLVNEALAEQILKSLEPDEREIMYCWAIEGFSTSEIAEKLDKPKGTILSKIYRMRKKLIEQFSNNSNEVMEEKS